MEPEKLDDFLDELQRQVDGHVRPDVLHCTNSVQIVFCPGRSQEHFLFTLPVPTVLEVKTVAARIVRPPSAFVLVSRRIPAQHLQGAQGVPVAG